MDLAVPQLDEERRIIATVDQLDELVVSLSAPREANVDPNDRIAAEMIYGGEIIEEDQISRGARHLYHPSSGTAQPRAGPRLPHPVLPTELDEALLRANTTTSV